MSYRALFTLCGQLGDLTNYVLYMGDDFDVCQSIARSIAEQKGVLSAVIHIADKWDILKPKDFPGSDAREEFIDTWADMYWQIEFDKEGDDVVVTQVTGRSGTGEMVYYEKRRYLVEAEQAA